MDEITRRIGVCSWSLRAAGPAELVERVRAVGVDCLQLALDPLRTGAWPLEETRAALAAAGLDLRSGMMGTKGEDYSTLESIRRTGGVRVDENWEENRQAASENARLARELGIELISFHAGFLPEGHSPVRTKLLARLREFVDRFAEHGVRAAFETGQESARTLLSFLEELDRPLAGVNFDPANLLLYDRGDPLAALEELAPWVRQIHVKDAKRTRQKGTWGTEVRVGTGEVDWPAFFALLERRALAVDLMIEREAGDDRLGDIRSARELIERFLARGRDAPPAPAERAPSAGHARVRARARTPRGRAQPAEVGVGLIGLGFMGRTHAAAYRAAARAGFPNRIVAVCDQDLGRFQGQVPLGNLAVAGAGDALELEGVATTADPAELLANPAVELVSLCTPTDSHVPLALAALAAGKHVLLEKPVALRAREVAKLARAARRARRMLMPAMCMRFWPGWSWLKERIKSREFGRVESAVFRRLAAPPTWSRAFYSDPERSGGALFDLHVHDADFVRHCFGAPREVVSTGSLDHVTTLYRFESGPRHAVAEGGWDHSPGYPFFMGYTVVFQRATAEFALGRTPVLTLAREGRVEPVPLEEGTGYDGEIRHALSVVRRRSKLAATIDEAVGLVATLEAEQKSLASGRPVRLRRGS
jgi:predicted dehydrogenase/sugar phosphate isomerase/epimerase